MTICPESFSTYIKKRYNKALAHVPHHGAGSGMVPISGTVQVPSSFSTSRQCLSASLILAANLVIGYDKKLTPRCNKITQLTLASKTNKGKWETGAKHLSLEYNKLYNQLKWPLEEEKQELAVIVPIFAEHYNVNVLIHATPGKKDEIIFQVRPNLRM